MDVNETDLVKSSSFAVVQLKPGSETKLLRVLIENGYTNVSFTNALGEMVKMIDDDHDIDDQSAENEERVKEEDVDVENVDNSTDVDVEVVKENEIAEKERELLESLYRKKSMSIDADEAAIVNENQQRKLLEQIEEQRQQSIQEINKIDPPSPFEFSSLTLPTVLWGGAAVGANNDQQSKFLSALFPYNPFLSLHPLLHCLPSAIADQTNVVKGDVPYLPQATTTEAVLSSSAVWNRPHHPSQLLDTPPTTPRGTGSSASNDSRCLITGTKLRQRGRQLRRHERESSAYASCRLCRNRILANRLSNLHNHVRRHAVPKQFHCCYCSYAHTEVAKVRLHMLHNHKDDRSQPIDKRNDDMEAAWSMLMRECFPGYA